MSGGLANFSSQLRSGRGSDDPYNLERFVLAQAETYGAALREMASGRKTSHWMWFIFPQLRGLGSSPMSLTYSVGSLDEARAYLAHPVLGRRLGECLTALENLPRASAQEIFGSVDASKLHSSLTLFMRADGGRLFEAALQRWFRGQPDKATDDLIGLAC